MLPGASSSSQLKSAPSLTRSPLRPSLLAPLHPLAPSAEHSAVPAATPGEGLKQQQPIQRLC